MELKVNIGYRQVLELVDQLPERDIQKLIRKIQCKFESHEKKRTSIQELILQAPTWTDEEYNDFLENRTHINQSKLK